MGKRELLLAAAFVLAGIVVYQVAAPAADPARPGWSVGGLVERMRREVRGNQATATAQSSSTIQASESIRELRILVGSVDLTVAGEERQDIQADLAVTSNAYDMGEAERTAKAVKLNVDTAGPVITVTITFPEEGRQRASLAFKVPARLELRIEKNNPLEVHNVAALAVTGRGRTTVKGVPGPVQVNQRGSNIDVTETGPLRLTTFSGAEAKVSNVRGDATFSLQGGELHAGHIDGGIEIEARNCEITLDNLEKARGQFRINATGGEVAVLGVQTELRIDGRETEIRVEQSAAAPLSIYNHGNETVELTVPAGGFRIDAATIDGRLNVEPALEKSGIKVTTSGGQAGDAGDSREEHRAEGSVRGGGPAITVRARGGDIVLRSK